MAKTIGIDLGTTNSVMCIKKINVSTIRNSEGEELTPSCVTAVPSNQSYDFVIGRASRDLLKQYPEQTVTSVKRLMGREFGDSEIQNIINEQRVGYPIVTDSSEPGSLRIPLGGKMQTPEMISGMILKKLVGDGESELQDQIDRAVVTVPAYFSDRQKFATRAACDYAGIKLLRLLPEPTAAALSFGLSEIGKNEFRTIMVFDLGGGTFDISILSLAGGSFMEITKGGDMWLGGDNIDQLLVDYVFAQTQKTTHCKPIPELLAKLSPADRARFMVEIKEKAESAKIQLSTEESATIEMFGLLKDEHNKLIDIDVTLTRQELSRLLEPIIHRIAHITQQILHEIRFEPELIDTVLMVGGSSLIPAIQDELKTIFGKEKIKIHPRPMFAIAEGAAFMAAKMTSQDSNVAEDNAFSMMHSAAHDYYLQLAEGKRHLLVARNTPLPVTVEEELTFSHEQQALARLRVLNDVEGILDTVGELWLHKDYKTGDVEAEKAIKFNLQFSVDEDNIITMKAWSAQNEIQDAEAQIARGGLAAKLYNELEQCLSSIVANSLTINIEYDSQRLSRFIVSTILSAADPITGETRIDQKQKAQQQIQTLLELHHKNMTPLSRYEFALTAHRVANIILSAEEKTHIGHILSDYKQAIENLTDITALEKVDQRLEQFYDDVPVAADLARADNAATLIESDDPSEAKKIRKQAQIVINSDKAQRDDAVDVLNDLVHSTFMMWSNEPTRRFDRDVCL